MKKVLVSLITFIILFNFIVINPISYAVTTTETYTLEDFEKQQNSGTGTAKSRNGDVELSTDPSPNVTGTIIGLFAKIINSPLMIFQVLITIVLESGGITTAHEIPEYSGKVQIFSIQNIIFGKYFLLDTNVFRDAKTDVDYTLFSFGMDDVNENFRNTIKLWFIILRDVALVLNLAMLIYVAIRLAIATVARDKAKYKELLYNWVVSMVILFFLQYILVAFNVLSESITSFARNFMFALEQNNDSFESTIINSMFSLLEKSSGMKMALYSIVYWILMWIEIKFFVMYIKRMLKMVFLVVISPIITVTYSVDKIKDGKAQAFSKWMQEYMSNLLIQPLHCYIYLAFMFMANNIATKAPLVGVIFLMSLTRAEKIVKSLLGVAGVQDAADQFSVKRLKGKLKGMVPKMPKPGAE